MTHEIIYTTAATAAYFQQIIKDADNWSGTPLFEGGDVENGYLTNLKKLGLITTSIEDDCCWIFITEKGWYYANSPAYLQVKEAPKMNREQVRELARKYKIKNYGKMKKDELMVVVQKHIDAEEAAKAKQVKKTPAKRKQTYLNMMNGISYPQRKLAPQSKAIIKTMIEIGAGKLGYPAKLTLAELGDAAVACGELQTVNNPRVVVRYYLDDLVAAGAVVIEE